MSLDYDVVVTHNLQKGVVYKSISNIPVLYKSIANTPSVFRSKWSTNFIKNFTVFRIRTVRENNLLNIYII